MPWVFDLAVVDVVLELLVDDGRRDVVVGSRVVDVARRVDGGAVDGSGTGLRIVVGSSGMAVVAVVVVPTAVSSKPSRDAVNSGVGCIPANAVRMVSAKMAAGNDPPVTGRPCTFVIGTMASG